MAKRMKENSKEKKQKNSKFLLVFFIALFLFSSINLIRWVIYNRASSKAINDITEKVIISNFENNIEDEENNTKGPVDFKLLKEINEDAIAWIRIDGTSVNYPILQTKDNDFYLHKDIYKKYSTCGWIFMDYKNSSNFIDRNTVIYGHNIKSGLMFADLLKIRDNKLGKDIIINIYTETERLDYKIFSSYQTEPEDYAIKSNIVEEADMKDYIDTMLNRSTILYNVVPNKSDRILTLSTCDSSGQNRVLVHGVYIGGEKY